MKSFNCDYCGQPIFFENVLCVNCGHALGYLPDLALMSALESGPEGAWRALARQAESRLYRMCPHYSREGVCNWMVPAEENEAFCRSCRLNKVIPDLSLPRNQELWQRLELGKRRLVYSLLRLGLPVINKEQDAEHGLAFAFLADPDPAFREQARVTTGHADGEITINIAEADDAEREKARLEMGEPYRTLLGHFRHESGHYYWERLIRDSDWLAAFRALFGHESEDYAQALQRHYEQGPPEDWQARFVSAYASAHPWEDWAETWAHYLHMVDTLETARAFGLTVKPAHPGQPAMKEDIPATGYAAANFDDMIENWFSLTFAINSINRSMGHKDLYPFVLSAPAIDKLRFVHEVVARARG